MKEQKGKHPANKQQENKDLNQSPEEKVDELRKEGPANTGDTLENLMEDKSKVETKPDYNIAGTDSKVPAGDQKDPLFVPEDVTKGETLSDEAPGLDADRMAIAKLFGVRLNVNNRRVGTSGSKPKGPISDPIIKARISVQKNKMYYGFCSVANTDPTRKQQNTIRVKVTAPTQPEAIALLKSEIDQKFTKKEGKNRSEFLVDVTDMLPGIPATDRLYFESEGFDEKGHLKMIPAAKESTEVKAAFSAATGENIEEI